MNENLDPRTHTHTTQKNIKTCCHKGLKKFKLSEFGVQKYWNNCNHIVMGVCRHITRGNPGRILPTALEILPWNLPLRLTPEKNLFSWSRIPEGLAVFFWTPFQTSFHFLKRNPLKDPELVGRDGVPCVQDLLAFTRTPELGDFFPEHWIASIPRSLPCASSSSPPFCNHTWSCTWSYDVFDHLLKPKWLRVTIVTVLSSRTSSIRSSRQRITEKAPR